MREAGLLTSLHQTPCKLLSSKARYLFISCHFYHLKTKQNKYDFLYLLGHGVPHLWPSASEPLLQDLGTLLWLGCGLCPSTSWLRVLFPWWHGVAPYQPGPGGKWSDCSGCRPWRRLTFILQSEFLKKVITPAKRKNALSLHSALLPIFLCDLSPLHELQPSWYYLPGSPQ